MTGGALNPLFVYLHDGPTEEAAKLTQEICKPTRGSMASDIFFRRGLKRDSVGVMVVIRDFHDPVPPAALLACPPRLCARPPRCPPGV